MLRSLRPPTRGLLPSLLLAATLTLPLTPAQAQNATTVPVGAVSFNITAGTGTQKVTSRISAPLFDSFALTGGSIGRVAALTSNSITLNGVNWANGSLSNASSPHIARIISGNASGLSFLISSSVPNTSNSITISSEEASVFNLTSLGIETGANGDYVEIIPIDTLSLLFGSPSPGGLLGGTSLSNSDSVKIYLPNGVVRSFFYSTSLNRWTEQAMGNPNATNFPIRPDFGIEFERLGNTTFSITLIGRVPTGPRKIPIRNASSTLVASFWPIPLQLSNLAITSANWTSNSTALGADIVKIANKNYFHDGTQWREQAMGNPISNPTINPGVSYYLMRRFNNSGYTILNQNQPYSLN